jgi:hypothetical protein
LEGFGISSSPLGKGQFDLTHYLASQTEDTLDFDLNKHRLQPYGDGSESPHDLTSAHKVFGIADRASVGKLVMSNPKDDGAFFVTGMNIFAAIDAECMVKETCGHVLVPFLLLVSQPKKESRMSFFFN